MKGRALNLLFRRFPCAWSAAVWTNFGRRNKKQPDSLITLDDDNQASILLIKYVRSTVCLIGTEFSPPLAYWHLLLFAQGIALKMITRLCKDVSASNPLLNAFKSNEQSFGLVIRLSKLWPIQNVEDQMRTRPTDSSHPILHWHTSSLCELALLAMWTQASSRLECPTY